MSGKRGLGALSVAIAAFGCVAGALAVADSQKAVAPSADTPAVPTVQPDVRDVMGVLRRPRVADDALPPSVSEGIGSRHVFGTNPGLSRRAIAEPSASLYVVPGDETVCASLVDVQGDSLSCLPTEHLASGRASAATVVLPGGNVGIYGLAPDEVTTVTVLTDGRRIDVQVVNNAYFAVVDAAVALQSLSYIGPEGRHETPLQNPADAF